MSTTQRPGSTQQQPDNAQPATPAAGSHRPAELASLDRLGAAMREAGIQAELRPDMEALLIYRPGARLPLWVFVGYGGASFSWQSGQKRHPVDDVGGAAAVLTAYLRGDDRTPAPR